MSDYVEIKLAEHCPGCRLLDVTSELARGCVSDVGARLPEGATVEVLSALGSATSGLSSAEAQRRLQRHGRNALAPPKRRSAVTRLLLQFHNVLLYIMLAGAVITAPQGPSPDERSDAGIPAASHHRPHRILRPIREGTRTYKHRIRTSAGSGQAPNPREYGGRCGP